MKLTVVTPSWNIRPYLEACIANVFASSKEAGAPAVEHIVMDAASTDGTPEMLRAWADKVAAMSAEERGSYSFQFVSEPDKGQTDAINKGLARGTGDIMCWLNADETYKLGALPAVASYFTAHPKVGLAHGEVDFVDADGKFIRRPLQHPFSFPVLLYHGCYIPSAATFWTRAAFETVGPLDPYYRVTMDYEYWLRFAKLGIRIGFIPRGISTFAWTGNNVSERLRDRRLAERRRVQMLYGPPVPKLLWHPYFAMAHVCALSWRMVLKQYRRLFMG